MMRSDQVHEMVVGTTEPQDFALENDEAAIDGTGLTPDIHIEDALTGEAVAGLSVTWLDQEGGTVRVDGADTLAVGRYKVRFSVDNGAGSLGWFPRDGQPMVWKVVEL
jgi:hypothetical protein